MHLKIESFIEQNFQLKISKDSPKHVKQYAYRYLREVYISPDLFLGSRTTVSFEGEVVFEGSREDAVDFIERFYK